MKEKQVISPFMKQIGQNIKQARLLKGVTQEKLAEKINKSTNFVSLLELGKSGMSLSTLVDICNTLQIDSSIIFNGLIAMKDTTEAESIAKTLSTFGKEDKTMVLNLIEYIEDKNRFFIF